MIQWLTATDHKKIGIMYMISTFFFFVVAGLLALVIRTQLAAPNLDIVSSHTYSQVFTLHGTAMIFLFVAPFGLGLANYLVPLQIGAPDMAFPRLNATSLWLFIFGAFTVLSGALVAGGRPPPDGVRTLRSPRSRSRPAPVKTCGSSDC